MKSLPLTPSNMDNGYVKIQDMLIEVNFGTKD
jgi:hypothetical protein